MRRQPIKMLRTVMHRMKPPKKRHPMLDAVTPVDEQIADENDFDRLHPPWLRAHHRPEIRRHDMAQPRSRIGERSENESAPQQILTEKKTEIRQPCRTKDPLGFGRKAFFKRREDDEQDDQAQQRCREIVEPILEHITCLLRMTPAVARAARARLSSLIPFSALPAFRESCHRS